MKNWSRRRRLAAALLVAAVVAFFAPPLPVPLRHFDQGRSLRVTDRNGVLLRQTLGPQAGVDWWLPLDQISERLVTVFLLSEDQRFYYHPGVDPGAVMRAIWTNLRQRERVSGGSSITQQLVRNLLDHQERSWSHKLSESYYALRLEATSSKKQLLEAYLNRIPFGQQVFGVEAAAQLYFGRSASELSWRQAATLAVLPRSPSTLDPNFDEHRAPLARLTDQLLARLLAEGAMTREEYQTALEEPLVLAEPPDDFLAPHFCDMILAQNPAGPQVKTTLDYRLQTQVEDLLRRHLNGLSNQRVTQAAVVVLEVDSGDILTMVGSADFFDRSNQGQFNAALAKRQPGSTLKPFTYSLCLETDSTPATLMPDIDLYPEEQGESFIPKNYDARFHGPVTLRTALACSYNVPAVRALESVGVGRLLRRLHDLGISHLDENPEHYGLGLTLGDGEVTLLQLAEAYRTLARGGLYSPARWSPQQEYRSRRVIDPGVAYLVTDILKDPQARAPAFGLDSALRLPFPCAAKTGTSKGYRDNWTVGYTPEHVVAVWVGNFGGEPMVGVSGVTGAGPLFHQVMRLLGPGNDFERPSSVVTRAVCPTSGELPGEHCLNTMLEIFLEDNQPQQTCTVHQLITLDRRSGRRASPECPPRFQEKKLYTVFAPLYHEWMVSVDMPLPPPSEEMGEGRPRLAFPQDGSVFVRDPVLRSGYQKVLFKAVVPDGTHRIDWLVDGELVHSSDEPRFWWRLRRGTHRVSLVAHGKGQRRPSSEINFLVR